MSIFDDNVKKIMEAFSQLRGPAGLNRFLESGDCAGMRDEIKNKLSFITPDSIVEMKEEFLKDHGYSFDYFDKMIKEGKDISNKQKLKEGYLNLIS